MTVTITPDWQEHGLHTLAKLGLQPGTIFAHTKWGCCVPPFFCFHCKACDKGALGVRKQTEQTKDSNRRQVPHVSRVVIRFTHCARTTSSCPGHSLEVVGLEAIVHVYIGFDLLLQGTLMQCVSGAAYLMRILRL